MEGTHPISLIGSTERTGFFRMEYVRLRIVIAGALRKCDQYEWLGLAISQDRSRWAETVYIIYYIQQLVLRHTIHKSSRLKGGGTK